MSKIMREEEKGVILIIVLLAMVVMAIFVPTLVFMVRNEAKWTLNQSRTTNALQMAEAGLDQGVWKLQESDEMWNSTSTGAVIVGYNYDVVYTSTGSAGAVLGQYKIKLSSGPSDGEVTITSIGHDASAKEVRAITAVYTIDTQQGGMEILGALNIPATNRIHWGQVTSYSNITLTGGAENMYYPKRISASAISPWDTDPNLPNDDSTKNYEAYREDLVNPPNIDLEYYKAKSKLSSCPNPVGGGGAWDETKTRKNSDKIKEDDYGIDLDGNLSIGDDIRMDEIEANCTDCNRTGAGAPSAGTSGELESTNGWYSGLTLYKCTSGCPDGGKPYYLDVDGDDDFADALARIPVGSVGSGDNGGQSAGYIGTCYFDGTASCEVKFKDYMLDSSTSVIFIENCKSKMEGESFIHVEAYVVASENTHIHSHGITGYTVSVPDNAWMQYTAGTVLDPLNPDTAAINEYPGDNGLGVSSSPWTLPSDLDAAGTTGVGLHAFVYLYSFDCGGGDNIIVGTLYVPTIVDASTITIYFDTATATAIQYVNGKITQDSWREVKLTW